MVVVGKIFKSLEEKMYSINFDKNRFCIYVDDDGRYISGGSFSLWEGGPDYILIMSIYDSLINLCEGVMYSFCEIVKINPSEYLLDYNPLLQEDENERIARHHTENMIFRTSTIWDMLAQFCNQLWGAGYEIDLIYVRKFFERESEHEAHCEFSKKVINYFDEEDSVETDQEIWKGNHQYVKEYRNAMTHRLSPSSVIISKETNDLRPPVVFLLKRVIEDYVQSISFFDVILDEFNSELRKGKKVQPPGFEPG